MKATRGRYGMRTIDGRTVGYFGGIALDTSDRNEPRWAHGRTTLYAVDIASNKPRVAARPAPEDHYRDWLIDASGAVSVTLDIAETNGVWTISTQGGLQLARGVDPTGDVSLVAFGRAGSSVIYRIEDDAGVQRWFEVPLTGGTPQEYLRDVPVERLFVDRTTGNLIGYRTMEEVPRTVMDDPAQQSALTRIFKAFAGREVRLVDWTPGFAKVLLRTSGNGDSGTWYIVDVARRRADPVANERPEINPEQVGAISQVDYTAQDGLGIDGVLTLPPGREAKGLPVVMLPHGGPAA
ncbi:hypothetical protein [Novosphingobium resinovorum]|uniref:hypothetical protein n=1 Tax=Novosphingobium resinovorum TaxID=158500 RepID=UPI002ED201EA|nr:hypothetical protein [Novosphingobium resinovorum]